MFETLKMLDRVLLLQINSMHHPALDGFMWYISAMWPTFLIVFAFAFAFYKRYSAKKAVEFLIGCALIVACTDLSTNFVKHGVKRYRPSHNLEIKERLHLYLNAEGRREDGGTYGFFSAHSANTFGVITFIFFCLHWWKRKYRLLIFIYPIMVAYSRMYLGMHYPSDIFVGTCSGLLFGTLGYYFMNMYFLKLHDEQKPEHSAPLT